MGLVEDHVIPVSALEQSLVTGSKGIGCDADVEAVLVRPTLAQFLPPLRRPMVAQDRETGEKLLEFHFPIEEDTGRYDLAIIRPKLPRQLN